MNIINVINVVNVSHSYYYFYYFFILQQFQRFKRFKKIFVPNSKIQKILSVCLFKIPLKIRFFFLSNFWHFFDASLKNKNNKNKKMNYAATLFLTLAAFTDAGDIGDGLWLKLKYSFLIHFIFIHFFLTIHFIFFKFF